MRRTPLHGFRRATFCLVLVTTLNVYSDIKLFWTETDETGARLVRSDPDGTNPGVILTGDTQIKGPNGLAAAHGFLYWPDQQLAKIQRIKPDGSDVFTFSTAVNPYGVFGSSTQLFWTSQSGRYIDRKNSDGTGYTRVFGSTEVNSPLGIQVTETHIYWSDASGGGSLIRADLNGDNKVVLLSNVLVYDFEVTDQYIYFADVNYPNGALKRSLLDGTGVVNLVTGAFGGVDLINGLCITSDAIYWSEYNVFSGGGVRRSNLDGSGPVDVYNASPGTGVRGVVLLETSGTVDSSTSRLEAPKYVQGRFQLTLEGVSGAHYTLESSSNLVQWVEITNFVSNGTTTLLTNAIPMGSTYLFYRSRRN